ncbi:hypothetical protein JIG36_22780 [Actinoplanes sp. LDG1-06]|uniref:Uncharacterized protein n=1 Tax=Paractinoplanes ovalisporus TaxID=2810368 RepID=A0ABS2AEX7_9ACTN|nr:hypothetical protein [Actinoplanes ovalisporus]MBM2618389.1 hypothetical protein [Actinoplanes ovalisporus]
MGLSGFVYCRCWKDAGLDGPIGFDEDGWLDLLTPEDPVARQWFRDGCEHDDFQVTWADLGSLGGQRYFRQTCEAIGWSLLPTMHEVLPTTNDGGIPAADVPDFLTELALFESQVGTVDETVLRDEDTGHGIHGCVGSHRSVFGWTGKLHTGIDADGFFVLDTGADPPAEVFRARRFTQRALPGDLVELTGDHGTARLPLWPIGSILPTTPERLAVVTRPQSAEDWGYRLGLLRTLCAASLATGNPVKWA